MASMELNADGVWLFYSGQPQNYVPGTSAAELLNGTASGDEIDNSGGGPGDTMMGGLGDDGYFIYYDHQTVIENLNAGIDYALATVSYALPANVENLQLYGSNYGIGNSLDNIIVGHANGLQLLDGKGGNDVLIASNKADIFVMSPGGGHDAIIGFKPTLDRARLDGSGWTTFAQVQSHLTQQGADVVLDYTTGERLVFRDLQVADLTAHNFMLPMDPSRLVTTFDDEFNSLSLYKNGGTWWTEFNTQNVPGSHSLVNNGEREVYVYPGFTGTGTTDLGLNPFSINNGILSINANLTPAQDLQYLWNYRYTSGLLTTKTTFQQQYGYFEVRAKASPGTGLWPAFWLSPVNATSQTEIDIFEALGQAPNTVHQLVHTQDPASPAMLNFSYFDNPDQFHTFGMKWDANYIVWYVDGVETARTPTPADMRAPMYIVLNQAVGGFWATNPDATTHFPAPFQVDYVRAYQLTDVAPTAAPDSYTIAVNGVLTVGVAHGLTANDTDPDATDRGWLAPVLVSGPSHGAVTLNLDGSFSYTPTANYAGADSFTYMASDGLKQSAPVTVTLTVGGQNTPPVAANGSASVAEDGAVSGKVSASDPDSAALTYVLVAAPTHGGLTFQPNGDYVYTPGANFNGADSFTFKVNDGQSTSNIATVTLSVTAVNDAPTAPDSSLSGSEDTPITGQLPAFDQENNALTFSVVAGPQHGVLTLNPNGAYTYTPTADYNGADSFTYQTNDGQLTSRVATVSLTLAAVNDAPTASVPPGALNASQGVNLNLKGAGLAIGDVDAGSGPMSLTLQVGEGVLNASAGDSGAAVAGSGTTTLTLSGTLAQINALLAAGGTSSLSFLDSAAAPSASTPLSLTVHDNGSTGGGDLSASVATTINVTIGGNHAPTPVADTASITSGYSLNILPSALLANDSDSDGDPLTITGVANGPHGTVQLSGGVITYTPTAGYVGADSFTYTVDDGHPGGSATGTVNVTVTAGGAGVYNAGTAGADTLNLSARTAPQLVNGGDGNDTVTGGSGNDTINGANGNDVLQGGPGADSLTGAAGADAFVFAKTDFTSPTYDVVIDFAGAGNGAVAGDDVIQLSGFSATATLTQVAVSGSKHTYEVTDGAFHGRFVVQYAGAAVLQAGDFVFVNGTGPATPVAAADSYSVAEDTPLSIAAAGVLGNDSNPGGGSLSAVLVSGPSHGSLSLAADGGFLYTPAADYFGSDSFTYGASAGGAQSAPATVTLTVTPVNDAPVVTGESATASTSGSVSFATADLLANDTDVDGDSLSIIAVAMGASPHGTVQLAGGVITYTPTVGYTGADSFTYTVSDGTTTAAGTVSVTISTMAGSYFNGTAGNDTLDYSGRINPQLVNSQGGDDTITGGAGADALNGAAGNDLLKGGGGADNLTGGAGSDTVTGGTGADTFVFGALSEFAPAGQEDLITDFSRADGDRIRLSGVDANANVTGDQAFGWLGTGAFTGVAGQLHYAASGADLIVSGDVNGDGLPDFQFKVLGVSALQAGDFYL